MLSQVGRARGPPCLLLFMPFSSNKLRELAMGPNPGAEPNMHQTPWTVQSAFRGRNGHATRESNSCRAAAQSNQSAFAVHYLPPSSVKATPARSVIKTLSPTNPPVLHPALHSLRRRECF